VETILYVVEIVLGLGLIILVHELGHFLAAKWFGVHVRKFAIGFGPVVGVPVRAGGRWQYRGLLTWGKGETEYSVRWLPLGGFVDLAGEHPEVEDGKDPRGLCNKPAWQRIVVFSAGVVMNAVLALALFTVAPAVGIVAPVPVVGDAIEGMPAAKAGIMPGDRILAVNGDPVETFEDLIWTVALADAGTSFAIDLERTGKEGAPEFAGITVASTRVPGSLFPMIGLEPEREPVIAKWLRPGALLEQAGFEEGDRIVAVDGRPVETWRALVKALADAPPGPVALRRLRGGTTKEVRVNPADLKMYEYGMAWPVEVGGVDAGSPAAEVGVRPHDRIAAIQDKKWPSADQVVETVKAAGADAEIRLTLLRGGEFLDVSCRTAMLPGADHPRTGISMGAALGSPVQVGTVTAGGPAQEAGLRPGDLIVSAGDRGRRVEDWGDLLETVLAAGERPVPLQVQRGGSVLATTLRAKTVPQERLSVADAVGMPMYKPLPRIYSPLKAAGRGLKQTGLWLTRVYVNLKQLMTGQVSTRAAAGPVGIVRAALAVASHGPGTMMEFIGMLAVCIAVLNFLPVPPFDGGHVLFVILERIKGGPISLKVRTWVWSAGWAAVLAIFLIVTYRDILGWIS